MTAGNLVTSFSAYQPRTFAARLAPSSIKVAAIHSRSVPLHYDLATAESLMTAIIPNAALTGRAKFAASGDVAKPDAVPTMCNFSSQRQETGTPNAVLAKGTDHQTASEGAYNRVYVLALVRRRQSRSGNV